VESLKQVNQEPNEESEELIIPYELLLYNRGYLTSMSYMELPHILTLFLEICQQVEAEATERKAINDEIAKRHAQEQA